MSSFRHIKPKPLIIAIESSCDDSCLAILSSNNKLIREFRSSQKNLHQPFGGVVPQLAAQGHRSSFSKFLEEDFIRRVFRRNRIEFIAVTAGPGIGSCLNVGYDVAAQMARSNNIPLVPINHLVT